MCGGIGGGIFQTVPKGLDKKSGGFRVGIFGTVQKKNLEKRWEKLEL